MPPHGIGGLTWGEWVSIIGIITFVATLVSLLFKYAVFGPLRSDLKELSKSIGALNHSLDDLNHEYDNLEKRVDDHDRRLDRHHERIRTLFSNGGGRHEN